MFKKRNLNSSGFTLIELMVVLVIIAALSLAGILVYTNAQKNARDAKRKADLRNISDTLEIHYNSSENQNCIAPSGTYCKPRPNWFFGTVPVDPMFGYDYGGVFNIKDGDKTYFISAKLEDGSTIFQTNRQ